MDQNIPDSWRPLLIPEFNKSYFKELSGFLANEYSEQICFPPQKDVFIAFDHCNFDDLKVVIIGQDPYHGPNQANGLCFSVREGVKIPPSLRNILKELESDVDIPKTPSGDLSAWAKQGVLMLNATLTVRKGEAGSHQKKGWEQFTDAVIKYISEHKENVVFMLWGGFAIKKGSQIDRKKHLVLESGHPSPMSANRGYWFGNKHFSQCNTYLSAHDLEPIQWELKQSQGLLFT